MNNTQLAIIQADELETIQRTAKLLAASGYFGSERDSIVAMAQVATKIMAGRELGFGAFASVNGIHVISGKPAIGANLMASAVKSSGRYDYRVKEMTKEKCVIEFFERIGDKRESIGISEFTKADATAAKTQNMDKFARNMLFARAMSNGVRWYCPDIFSGNAVYVPEELGAEVDGDGNVVDTTYTVTPPPEPTQTPVEATGQPDLGDATFSREGQGKTPLVAKSKGSEVLSEGQLKRLHAAGVNLYGKEEWDTMRPKLVQAVTTGAATSCTELSPKEATKLIDGIEKRIAEIAAKVQQSTSEHQPVAA